MANYPIPFKSLAFLSLTFLHTVPHDTNPALFTVHQSTLEVTIQVLSHPVSQQEWPGVVYYIPNTPCPQVQVYNI